MSFAYKELLWLTLLAPATLALGWWFWRRRLAATRSWASQGLWQRLRFGYRPGRRVFSLSMLALAVGATATSLAQPRWGEAAERVEREGVDVVFVLDSSLSMSANDVVPSRIYAAQAMVRVMVRELPGNRVALVQAEGEGVVMAPLTVDAAVIDLLLDTIAPGTLPTPGTGLAHALNLAIDLFPEESETHRVVVLLSDGEDHEGGLDDLTERLHEAGIVAHALGIGTHRGGPMPEPGGAVNELKRDRQGDVIVTKLEDEALRAMASVTGGLYLNITDAGADLSGLVAHIESMETRSFEGDMLTALEDRFQWPLGLAAASLLMFLGIPPIRRTREATQ
jgi:Ca-activated chloride channel family protein